MITQEENLKLNLYKKFKAFYDGNAYEFPKWEFIYRATKLSEKTKSDFATLIYHVLNDLFSETSVSWFEYVSIDKENKITTGFYYTYHLNKVNTEKTEIITDYKSKPEHEWNWLKDKTIETLNLSRSTHSSHKYQQYLKVELNAEIWAPINTVQKLYRDFFLPNIHSNTPATSFEDYIIDESQDYEQMSISNKMKEISSNNDLDFYYSKKFCKFKDHELFIEEVDDFFSNGEGKNLFELLPFLNLFEKQLIVFAETNRLGKPYSSVEHLKNLYQLSQRERHTLYGMLLKYYEKYPTYPSKSLKGSFIEIALSLLQLEFLKYPENTPEKKFCLNRGIRKKEIPLITFPNSSYYKYTEDSFKNLAKVNDWDFYYSLEVNQKVLLIRTIEHFEIGLRKGLVEPKAILNLIYKYYALFKEQEDRAKTNLRIISELPIEEELKHIVLGFILFWYCGENATKIDSMTFVLNDISLKLIRKAFLSYEGVTPEKQLLGFEPCPENDSLLDAAIQNIQIRNSITERLDYWLTVKDLFKIYYPKAHFDIPLNIYLRYFEPYQNSIEFLKWVDNYEIKKYFKESKHNKTLQEKLHKEYIIDFIKAELKELEKFKDSVKILKIENLEIELNNLRESFNKQNNYEYSLFGRTDVNRIKQAHKKILELEEKLEFLKITERNYYERIPLEYNWFDSSNLSNNVAVQTYIKHILYKEELENQLKGLESNETTHIDATIPSIEMKSNNYNQTSKDKQHRNPVSAVVIVNVINAIDDYAIEKFNHKNYKNNKEKFDFLSEKIKDTFGNDYLYSPGSLKNAFYKEIDEDDKAKVIEILKEFKYHNVVTKYKNDN